MDTDLDKQIGFDARDVKTGQPSRSHTKSNIHSALYLVGSRGYIYLPQKNHFKKRSLKNVETRIDIFHYDTAPPHVACLFQFRRWKPIWTAKMI